MNWDGFCKPCLFTQTKFFDQCAIFVNVVFGIVGQETLALTYHGKQCAAGRVVFFKLAEVIRKTLDAVSKQCNLYFCIACVIWLFAVLRYDFGDFFFTVIDCHFSLINDE